MSRRSDILTGFQTRLEAILIAGGFVTDAGENVHLGEAPSLGPDDPDIAVVIIVNEDSVTYQGEQVMVNLPLTLQAIAKADLEEPYLAAEQVLGDIKKAVELADRTLGGLVKRQIQRGPTRTLPREPGSTTVGVGITYIVPYTELWGTP